MMRRGGREEGRREDGRGKMEEGRGKSTREGSFESKIIKTFIRTA